MFIVLGIITITIGLWAYICLPDAPMEAGFLEEQEIVQVLVRVSENQNGVGSKRFEVSQAMELASDPQIYLLIMITVLVSSCRPYPINQSNFSQVFRLERCHRHLLCDYY